MSIIKQSDGTRTALTAAAITTLASATYGVSNVKDNTTNQPIDLFVELEVTPGTVAAGKQAVLFAKASFDNTNWQTGPESGTTTTDESDLTYIGTLALNTNATQQRRGWSVASAFGGVLPPYIKFIVKNDSGVAFTAAALYTSEITGLVV